MKKTNSLTVKQVYDWLNEQMPFEAQEEFDNAGFQLGKFETEVSGILLTLDVTEEVIQEARELNANLIIVHHPLLFVPQRDLNENKFVPGLLAELLRHQIALIAVHTNADQSPQYSASAALANLLRLNNIRKEGNYLFLGDFENEITADALQANISKLISVPARLYGDETRAIHTLAIAGGAYSEGFEEARLAGAQALLTGEVRHHHAVEAQARGMVLLDGGHFATEQTMLAPLALGLQSMLDKVRYPVQVHVSRCLPYRLQ